MHDERLFYLLSVKRLAPDHINPTSTGLFYLVVALGGRGSFPPPSIKFDPEIQIIEIWKADSLHFVPQNVLIWKHNDNK